MFRDFLEISLSTSVVILGLLLLSPLFHKRYAAKWCYVLWLAVTLRLLIPFHFTLPEAPVRLPVINDITWTLTAENPPAGASAPEEITVTAGEIAEAASGGIAPETLLILIWAAGAILFLGYHIAGYLWFRRKIRPWCVPFVDGKPPVMRCRRIESPMLIGFFKPAILLPETDCSEEELAIILTHERMHYRRRDVWYKLLLLVANAVHWFNPTVYLMVYAANRDLELSCDDMVTKDRDMEFRKAYSRTILQSVQRGKAIALSTCFKGTKQDMKKRFSNILSMDQKKAGALLIAVVLLISAVLSSCIAWSDDPYLYRDAALGFSVEIPASWEGKYGVEKNGETVSFYHLAIRERYQNGMGHIFAVHRLEGTLTDEEVNETGGVAVAAHANGCTYTVSIPTDVQYPVWEDGREQELSSEYLEMSKYVETIKNSLKTFPPDGSVPESDITRLYEYKNTHISQARPIMEMAKQAGLPVSSLGFEDDKQCVTVNYKVPRRSDYRFLDRRIFDRTMALMFALMPELQEIYMRVYDDYGDQNVPDTSFDGAYCHRNLLHERKGMEAFTLPMIAAATETLESFAAYMQKLTNLPPRESSGNAQATARYAQLSMEEEFTVNSLLTKEVTVTAKMTIEESLTELLPDPSFLKDYIDKTLEFQTFVVRNFVTGETHSRLFVFEGNRLVRSDILPGGDSDAVKLIQKLTELFQ